MVPVRYRPAVRPLLLGGLGVVDSGWTAAARAAAQNSAPDQQIRLSSLGPTPEGVEPRPLRKNLASERT